MGIYDRDYIHEGRPASPSMGRGGGVGGGGGGGGWGVVSDYARLRPFNFWLIVINVAVFLLTHMFMANVTTTVPYGVRIADRATPDQVERAQVEEGRATPDPQHPGMEYRRLITPEGQVVGFKLYLRMQTLQAWGHFSTDRGFFGVEVWRLITFQFLHAGFWHLAFNMIGLLVFGGAVEEYLGSKKYAAFYLVCGIFGGLSYLALNFMGAIMGINLPGVLFNDTATPLIGASAGVFGVIMACAYIQPNARIYLLFPPIPLKVKWFAYAYVALAAFNLFAGGQNAGGDAAHLGGALAGFFFIRRAYLLTDFFDVFKDSRKPRPGGGPAPPSTKVDAVLDKAHRQGVHSLTKKEKRILQQATRRERDA